MRPRRNSALLTGVVICAALAFGVVLPADDIASASLAVDPLEATVGERIQATLTIVLPSDVRLEPPTMGPYLGPFTVNEGAWIPADRRADRVVWTWKGTLSAFRVGELAVPGVNVVIRSDADDRPRTISTAPVTVTVVSVLDGAESVELADLKPPASVPPDYSFLVTLLVVMSLLGVAAGVAWWLKRRYAGRLAAARVPDDPFHRVPPHVWVYGELQKLLERKLPEAGRIDEFYAALATILKRYLTGRYRVELLEQTTADVPDALHQAGAPEDAIEQTSAVLIRCDRVKFARDRPEAVAWKAAVEEIYRIVDRTKPLERVTATDQGVA